MGLENKIFKSKIVLSQGKEKHIFIDQTTFHDS